MAGLRVSFVQSLADIVEPVVDYLTAGVDDLDLFESQYLIVPTAGVRAWLVPRLASTIGTGAGARDGILANVRIGYIGMVNALLRDGVEDEFDAWSIDHVTMAVLRVIHDRSDEDPLVKKYGGHLRAARAMADRFDRYAARRPQLIRQWENAIVTGEEIGRDNSTVEAQFALWRAVREVIGVPSWPTRTAELCARMNKGEAVPGVPRRLLVAGIEGISLSNLELLRAISSVSDVHVLVVDPSPQLHEQWSDEARALSASPGHAPARTDDTHVAPENDVLVSTWLRGSFELQMLLASQDVQAGQFAAAETFEGADLLSRMKQAVADPRSLTARPLDADDASVQIHRGHNLARQVEILRDAILHAFNDLENLQPHDVLVLCADIASAAPLLQATFEQAVTVSDDPKAPKVRIPLVVADRSLRDVSAGAELLANVVALINSRFDVSSVMRVATSELVTNNLGLDAGDINTWVRHIESTRVRWGLDVAQRTSAGLDAPGVSAHTWKQAIDRALLGALVPDAAVPARELGGVVPLPRVDTAEIDALTALSGILSALSRLEQLSHQARPVAVWCDEIETLLVDLCGASCTDVDDVLALVSGFRQSAVLRRPDGATIVDDGVRFDEFADLLVQKISATPGHQPLRTGAITATSFVPLRSVPFRVVCVVGLDDGTLTTGEVEGDDIVAAEPLMGDPDPRLEARRVLLDAFMAAGERFIVTCNGRSIRNNSHVPFVTPLAELVDFCGRLGVTVPDDPEKPCSIEYHHPRHASSRRNFISHDGPVEGRVWSHDRSALVAAQNLGQAHPAQTVASQVVTTPYDPVPLSKIESMVVDPLTYYLKETLRIFDDYEEGDPGAVLPVSASQVDIGRAASDLVKAAGDQPLAAVRDQWRAILEASDVLPVGQFGVDAAETAFQVAAAVRDAASVVDIPLIAPDPVTFTLTYSDGVVIECDVPHVVERPDKGIVYSIRFDEYSANDIVRIGIRLLALRAADMKVDVGYVVQRDTRNKSNKLVNVITLDDSITKEDALQRMRRLADAEPFVRVVPCPSFGGTASALVETRDPDCDDVLDAFDSCLEGYGYESTTESLVYGADPTFAQVYSTDIDDVIDFFEVRAACSPVPDGGKNDGYLKWVVS